MALSPDSRTLLLGFEDGDIKVFDTADWSTRTLQGHTDRVVCMTFSSSGHHIASGSKDKAVRIWNFHDSTDYYALCGHTSQVNAVVFSPDGLQLASGSDDMTVRVWNMDSKSSTFIFDGHTAAVRAVAWLSDRQRMRRGV